MPVNGTIRGLLGSSVVMTSVPVRVPATVGAKVTFMVQVVDVAMGKPAQVLDGKLKSPVALISEIFSGVAPTLFRITVKVPLVVPTPCLPKSRDAGEAEAADAVTPVPANVMIRGLLGSSVEMISEPVLGPAAVGEKFIFNVQLVEVAIGKPLQVLDGSAKSPVELMSEMLSGFTPMLVRVTSSVVLVVPTP